MAKQQSEFFANDRMVKNAAEASRGDRGLEDQSRTNDEGTSLSIAERRAALRREWVQDILPQPPEIPGFHTIWLSTTNQQDPLYKRVQLGYVMVQAQEVPGFESLKISSGEYVGGIACNEMILFKINKDRYFDLMEIFHHDMPMEEEELLKANAVLGEEDKNGKKLGQIEGEGYNSLGVHRKPKFS